MKRGLLGLPLCLLLTGCGTLPFKNPLFTVTFGPLLTISIGEKNDKTEINAYGEKAAHEAISSVTEAIHIELPARPAEGDVSEPTPRSKNLW